MPERREAMAWEIMSHLEAESAQDLPALLAGMTEDCYNLVLCDPSPLYRGPDAVASYGPHCPIFRYGCGVSSRSTAIWR